MAYPKKNPAGKRHSDARKAWLWAGLAGIALVIIAAAALLRQEKSPDQQAFDPNFKPQVTGAPRLEVLPQDVIDYGAVKLGEVVTTVYTVRNVGDRPLTILGEPRVELVEGC